MFEEIATAASDRRDCHSYLASLRNDDAGLPQLLSVASNDRRDCHAARGAARKDEKQIATASERSPAITAMQKSAVQPGYGPALGF